MQVEINDKLKIKLTWLGVVIIFVGLGIFDLLSLKKLSYILISAEIRKSIISVMVTASFFLTVISKLTSWVINSIVLKLFLSIILECDEKLSQGDSFICCGYCMSVLLLASVISYCLIDNFYMVWDYNYLGKIVKCIQEIGSIVSYLCIVGFISWYEQLTFKRIIALSTVFAVLFIVGTYIVPLVYA